MWGDTKELCRNWQNGTCRKGEKCKFRHSGPKGAKARTGTRTGEADPKGKGGSSSQSSPSGKSKKKLSAASTRCRHDYEVKKCPYGDKCKFEHKDAAVNKVKPAAAVDHSNHTCNACGKKGHITYNCKKIKDNEVAIKAATSFTGDHKWFYKEDNVKKFRELVKVRGWFAAQSTKAFDWSARKPEGGWTEAMTIQAGEPGVGSKGWPSEDVGKVLKKVDEYDDCWVDGGWCQLGGGARRYASGCLLTWVRPSLSVRDTCSRR